MEPPTPPRPAPKLVALLAVGCLAVFVYAVLAMGNLLVGLFPIVAVLVGYFGWRFLVAVEVAADALQRLADAREAGEE